MIFVTKGFKIEMVISVYSGVMFVGETIAKKKEIGEHVLIAIKM